MFGYNIKFKKNYKICNSPDELNVPRQANVAEGSPHGPTITDGLRHMLPSAIRKERARVRVSFGTSHSFLPLRTLVFPKLS